MGELYKDHVGWVSEHSFTSNLTHNKLIIAQNSLIIFPLIPRQPSMLSCCWLEGRDQRSLWLSNVSAVTPDKLGTCGANDTWTGNWLITIRYDSVYLTCSINIIISVSITFKQSRSQTFNGIRWEKCKIASLQRIFMSAIGSPRLRLWLTCQWRVVHL